MRRFSQCTATIILTACLILHPDSYDGRPGSPSSMASDKRGSHWLDTSVLSDRAGLILTDTSARLSISPVHMSDAGLYKCRVDFRRQPTKTTRIVLQVISECLIVIHSVCFYLSEILFFLQRFVDSKTMPWRIQIQKLRFARTSNFIPLASRYQKEIFIYIHYSCNNQNVTDNLSL